MLQNEDNYNPRFTKTEKSNVNPAKTANYAAKKIMSNKEKKFWQAVR